MKPIIIVGAGPVGLLHALACKFYGLDFILFEEDSSFSSDTKAGTLLTRTIEIFRRYGVDEAVLSQALRLDRIGEVERSTGLQRPAVMMENLREETRFPFVLNMPQHQLEPILAAHLDDLPAGVVNLNHKVLSFEQNESGVRVQVEHPGGHSTVEGSYLIACDGGRSAIREKLGIVVEGKSLDVRYMLVDVAVDLDVKHPRDYPYLGYFSDPHEWMILVRQPHCWRFLFPVKDEEPSVEHEVLKAKVRHFVGDIEDIEIINTVVYRVHHRIATKWKTNRVFLAGDAAHLITPMWALGLNTGALDALNLPWRLAWVLRGWADPKLLDGYEAEEAPLATHGSGELAEAARQLMSGEVNNTAAMAGSDWANAMTRSMLGVRLDTDGTGEWSIVKRDSSQLRVGDRLPDMPVFDAKGRRAHLHDLCDNSFLALHFRDIRRRPALPEQELPGLQHRFISKWDAPLDSGLRAFSLLDVGNKIRSRFTSNDEEFIVLVRPDDHIAAILPSDPQAVVEKYKSIVETGR